MLRSKDILLLQIVTSKTLYYKIKKHYKKNILIDKRMLHHYIVFFVYKKCLDVKVKNKFNFARNSHTLLNHIFSKYECEICDYIEVEPFQFKIVFISLILDLADKTFVRRSAISLFVFS